MNPEQSSIMYNALLIGELYGRIRVAEQANEELAEENAGLRDENTKLKELLK